MYNLLCIIVVYNKGTKGNELQQGHEKFSVSAASLISDRSRELTRKTSGFRHTHALGLDAAVTTKILQRSFCWSSFSFVLFTHWINGKIFCTVHLWLSWCGIKCSGVNWLIHKVNIENEESCQGKRFSERLSFASFVRAGTTSFSGVRASTIKPKQNEGSERLASRQDSSFSY